MVGNFNDEEDIVNEKNIEKELFVKSKRRRIFFLEIYISFFKLGIDEDNYLLLNFVRSD